MALGERQLLRCQLSVEQWCSTAVWFSQGFALLTAPLIMPSCMPVLPCARSPQMRRELLWTGLQEGRLEVRKAAQELLGKWFVEDAAGDVTRLVAALGPQESPGTYAQDG